MPVCEAADKAKESGNRSDTRRRLCELQMEQLVVIASEIRYNGATAKKLSEISTYKRR